MGIFAIFLYTLTINLCHYKHEFEICLLSICYASFVVNNVFKNISSRRNVDLFTSVLKNIPNNTTPSFQEVGGVTHLLIFCRRHENVSWYRVKHHKID